MTAQQIGREILRAFSAVPRPAEAGLLISHACCECEALAADLFPFAMDAVPDAFFAGHVWDLPLLSDEGKHYYLPAWLLHGLRPGGESAIDAVVFALDADHRWNPTPPYTAEEWLAVDRWLAFVAAQPDAPAQDIERVRGKLPR